MVDLSGEIAARLTWSAFDLLPALTANQFLVQAVPSSNDQHRASELVLNIGFFAPPTITSDPEEFVRYSGGDERLSIPVQPIARMSLTRERVTELKELLERVLVNEELR